MSWVRGAGLVALAVVATAAGACRKVPLFDVNAGFAIADAAWFEEEETLFVFWEVNAEQGLSENSVIELRYNTDDERVDWTDINSFEPVHTHVAVDCGLTSLCGSYSLRVPIEPRDVEVRLRYHRDGELTLDPNTIFNAVGAGVPYGNRSLLLYGVFDELNEHIQWRSRHNFPTLRNMEAEALGLRRDFYISDQRYGIDELDTPQNPYGYAVECPEDFAASLLPDVQTNERAVFVEEPIPFDATDATVFCAEATVTDATGDFVRTAIAQKNPEVRPAFPALRSPIHEATQIPFFLAPCNRTISEEHEEMQRQRLMVEELPTTCIDDWDTPTFVDRIAEELTDAIEAERPAGEDMVLVIGLHQDEAGAAAAVEEALAVVLPEERHRSTPRVAGAFIFDSTAHLITDPALASSALWCPASPASAGGSLTCAIAPSFPDLELGPFTFGTLPILPTRSEYLDFIDTYSQRQAGSVLSSSFKTPEFAATADHFDIGGLGVGTFLNGELFSADADDAFSYCAQEDGYFFLFRSEVIKSDAFRDQAANFCAQDPEGLLCTAASLGALPVELLPIWHSLVGEESYDLGLFWDFPFLLEMEFESFLAGSASAFQFSVPFGIAAEGETYYGSAMWTSDTFSMEEMVTQCRRFCDQPTFDGAEFYRILEPFDTTYASSCFTPSYPSVGDPGFPFDP